MVPFFPHKLLLVPVKKLTNSLSLRVHIFLLNYCQPTYLETKRFMKQTSDQSQLPFSFINDTGRLNLESQGTRLDVFLKNLTINQRAIFYTE